MYLAITIPDDSLPQATVATLVLDVLRQEVASRARVALPGVSNAQRQRFGVQMAHCVTVTLLPEDPS